MSESERILKSAVLYITPHYTEVCGFSAVVLIACFVICFFPKQRVLFNVFLKTVTWGHRSLIHLRQMFPKKSAPYYHLLMSPIDQKKWNCLRNSLSWKHFTTPSVIAYQILSSTKSTPSVSDPFYHKKSTEHKTYFIHQQMTLSSFTILKWIQHYH